VHSHWPRRARWMVKVERVREASGESRLAATCDARQPVRCRSAHDSDVTKE